MYSLRKYLSVLSVACCRVPFPPSIQTMLSICVQVAVLRTGYCPSRFYVPAIM